jgi:hypothetical protein
VRLFDSRPYPLSTPEDPRRLRHAARRFAETLRGDSDQPDRAFDRFLQEPFRVVSPHYWSPLVAAKRAAQWLDEAGVESVVDIGSGVGKFCVAGAIFGRCRFVGLEQRPFLVDAARRLAHLFEVHDRVRFALGSLGEVPTPTAEAYYFFNPFGEYSFGSDPLEERVSMDRNARDVAAAEQLLHAVPVGTWVLTFNGFGGRMPPGYDLIKIDWTLPSVLRLWHKGRT